MNNETRKILWENIKRSGIIPPSQRTDPPSDRDLSFILRNASTTPERFFAILYNGIEARPKGQEPAYQGHPQSGLLGDT